MSTTVTPARTGPATADGPPPSGRLRGVTWLVWRQHRAAWWTGIAATLLGAAVILYQYLDMRSYLESTGWDGGAPTKEQAGFNERYGEIFTLLDASFAWLPLIIGVFLGAPLIAGDRERGTTTLISTQSITPFRWFATKLAVTTVMIVVCVGALSALYTWWWRPVHLLANAEAWLMGPFHATGPVPVALSLLFAFTGVAVGMLLRRTVASMAVTGFLALVGTYVWQEMITRNLDSTRKLFYPYDDEMPPLPLSAVQIDDWAATGEGKLYGWGTCVTEKDADACMEAKGITRRMVEYFDYSQMTGMQWTGAALLLTAAALIAAGALWHARRRPL